MKRPMIISLMLIIIFTVCPSPGQSLNDSRYMLNRLSITRL